MAAGLVPWEECLLAFSLRPFSGGQLGLWPWPCSHCPSLASASLWWLQATQTREPLYEGFYSVTWQKTSRSAGSGVGWRPPAWAVSCPPHRESFWMWRLKRNSVTSFPGNRFLLGSAGCLWVSPDSTGTGRRGLCAVSPPGNGYVFPRLPCPREAAPNTPSPKEERFTWPTVSGQMVHGCPAPRQEPKGREQRETLRSLHDHPHPPRIALLCTKQADPPGLSSTVLGSSKAADGRKEPRRASALHR